MLHHKKIAVVLSLASLLVIGMAATSPTDDKPPKRNLKVLPKDISHDDLQKTMHTWSNSLGVHCNFCHAATDSTSQKLDFASDAKPEKNIARHMFRMTAKINKKYFSFNKNDQGAVIPAISCVTCHRGSPHPDETK
jgi:hypothetical protein